MVCELSAANYITAKLHGKVSFIGQQHEFCQKEVNKKQTANMPFYREKIRSLEEENFWSFAKISKPERSFHDSLKPSQVRIFIKLNKFSLRRLNLWRFNKRFFETIRETFDKYELGDHSETTCETIAFHQMELLLNDFEQSCRNADASN